MMMLVLMLSVLCFGSARSRYEPDPVLGMAEIYIASSDASSEYKRSADYVCDGTADQVQIQAAIDKLWSKLDSVGNTVGGVVILDRGPYTINDTILMRHKVSVKSTGDCSHGTKINVAGDTDKHAFEICFPAGQGQAELNGIYVEGNNRWATDWKTAGLTADSTSFNNRGCGFMMPGYAFILDGPATATYEITATTMTLKVGGVAVAGGTFTLSNDAGTLVTLIAAIEALADWTCTDITGRAKSSAATIGTATTAELSVVNCTKIPSKCLYDVTAGTDCSSNAVVYLDWAYDFFFNRCMALHTAQTGFNIQNGHSIHIDRCVSEYVTGDAENSYQGACGFAIEGAFNIDSVRITNCYSHSNNIACYWINASDTSCIGNWAGAGGLTGSYGFRIKDRSLITNCWAISFYETYSAGTQRRNGVGFFVTGSRPNISNSDAIDCRSGFSLHDADTTALYGVQCIVDGCHIITGSSVTGTSYGIYTSLGTVNTITDNVIISSVASGQTNVGIYNNNHSNKYIGNTYSYSGSGTNSAWSLPAVTTNPYVLAVGNSPQPEPWAFSSYSGNTPAWGLTMTSYSQMSGAAIASNTAAQSQQFILPAATFGMEFTFKVGADHAGSSKVVTLTPATGENIVLSGTALDDNHSIAADNLNEMVKLKCLQTGYWYNVETVGTWTEVAD